MDTKNPKAKDAHHHSHLHRNRSRQVLTHFLMFPFESENYLSSYKLFSQTLIKSNSPNFIKELLQLPGKLHMSIVVLDLDSEKEKKINEVLTKILPDIKNIVKGELTFNFDSYNYFGKSTSSKVVYEQIKKDDNEKKAKEIINLIIKTLIDNRIIDPKTLAKKNIKLSEDKQYSVTLHVTLLNKEFLNKNAKDLIKSINFDEINNIINSVKLDNCTVKKINLCKMGSDSETKYEIVNSYDLY